MEEIVEVLFKLMGTLPFRWGKPWALSDLPGTRWVFAQPFLSLSSYSWLPPHPAYLALSVLSKSIKLQLNHWRWRTKTKSQLRFWHVSVAYTLMRWS